MRRISLLLLFAAAGCAHAYEGRIATRLHQAGLSRRMSDCMARRWVDRLSVFQLRKIQNFTNDLERQRNAGRLSVVSLVDAVHHVDDPEIVRVVTKSAAICAIDG